jgi:hypothetical protein
VFSKWIERIRLEWQADGASLSRRLDLKLRFDSAPPFYTLLLFVPALIGIVAAAFASASLLFQRSDAGEGPERKWWAPWRSSGRSPDPGTRRHRRPTDFREATRRTATIYVFFGTISWVVVIAWFAAGFVLSDLQAINLFGPNLRIPVLIPVAAFLGVLVFATGRLLALAKDGNTDAEREAMYLELGNRTFIAPYVAIVLVLIAFDDRSGEVPTLAAFATGLWIEPVLESLRILGQKLLPTPDRLTVLSRSVGTPSTITPLADSPGDSAPVPVITKADWIAEGGNAKLRIEGSGFRPNTTVAVDGVTVKFHTQTPRELTVLVPAPAEPTMALAVAVTTPAPGGGVSSAIAGAANA